MSEGQVIHVIFRQDATGGRQYVGGSVVGDQTPQRRTMFQLSSTPSAVDVFTFVGNTSRAGSRPGRDRIARDRGRSKRSVTIDL